MTATRTIASPWGPVRVTATARGIRSVELRPAGHAAPPADGDVTVERLLVRGCAALEATWAGAAPPDLAALPLDWDGIAAWDRRVLEGARTLGRGEPTSYGRLAYRIGAPGAARAVGAALGRNRFWLFIPCHRVVAGDGTLGGYGDGPDALDIKRNLLALEGLTPPLVLLAD